MASKSSDSEDEEKGEGGSDFNWADLDGVTLIISVHRTEHSSFEVWGESEDDGTVYLLHTIPICS